MKSLGGTSRPPKQAPRIWRWCSHAGRGVMLEPGAEVCAGCGQPIPPVRTDT